MGSKFEWDRRKEEECLSYNDSLLIDDNKEIWQKNWIEGLPVGDLVLNPKLNDGKLDPNWEEPYQVYEKSWIKGI